MYKLYRETMEELRAPQEKLEEIIAMTEHKNKEKFSIRPMLAAALAVALLTVGAGAANLDSIQGFLYEVISMKEVDVFRTDLKTEGGDITLFDMTLVGVEAEDGRVILTVGDETLDITDELAENGQYVYDRTLEGTHVYVDVTGTPEDYEVLYSMDVPDSEGPVVRYTVDADGVPVVESAGQDAQENVFVSAYGADVENGDIRSIAIVPENGK